MLPTSSEGNTSTLARPLRGCWVPWSVLPRHNGCVGLQLSVENEVGRHFFGDLSGADHFVDALMACAALGGEAEYCHTRLYAGYVAAVCAADTAICASSSAVGSGTTAQSAKTSMPSVPKLSPSGSSMRKAPETTLMPGCVLITWNAARSTLPVVFLCACHLSVGVAGFHHQAAEI